MTASQPSQPRFSASGSARSPTTTSRPALRSSSAFAGSRTSATTVSPRARSRYAITLPKNPVVPVANTLTFGAVRQGLAGIPLPRSSRASETTVGPPDESSVGERPPAPMTARRSRDVRFRSVREPHEIGGPGPEHPAGARRRGPHDRERPQTAVDHDADRRGVTERRDAAPGGAGRRPPPLRPPAPPPPG